MPPTDTSEDTATAPAPSRVLDPRAADLLVCLPALATVHPHRLPSKPSPPLFPPSTSSSPLPTRTTKKILPLARSRASPSFRTPPTAPTSAGSSPPPTIPALCRLAADRLNQAHTPSTLLILVRRSHARRRPTPPRSRRNFHSQQHRPRRPPLPPWPVGRPRQLPPSSTPSTAPSSASTSAFPCPSQPSLVSARMSQRLASVAQRLVAVNQGTSLLWPVAEAAIAGFSVREVDAAESSPPSPAHEPRLQRTLRRSVAGSLFSDIEARASFWQRAAPSIHPLTPPTSPSSASTRSRLPRHPAHHRKLPTRPEQPAGDLVARPPATVPPRFQKACPTPRRSLRHGPRPLGPHRLRLRPRLPPPHPQSQPPARRHDPALPCLGQPPTSAPWTTTPPAPQHAIEQTAAAFETEKPYFVSRWRWPDRFNP